MDNSRRATWLAGMILLLAVIAAYANSFSGPFVFDDVPAIRDNPTIRNWREIGRMLSPPERTTVSGRPVVNVSLALSYALSGKDPWGYHGVNLLIHAGATLLLFGLLRRTFQLPRWSGTSRADAAAIAFGGAALWALHPLQTESVTYLVQRAESLMGFFYLLTLYCFVRGSGSARLAIWQSGAIVACALGMATKEVMASAPLIVLLYDRTFVAGSFREAWRRHGRWHAGLAATWIVLITLVVQTGGNRGGSIGFGVGIGWWAHAVTQFHAITHYLWQSFWPNPLVFEYEPEWVQRFADVAPDALSVAALLTITVAALRRNRATGFAGALFFAVLAPTSLVPAPTQLIVEHRLYLCLAVLLPAGAFALRGAIGGRRSLVAVMALAMGCGALTARRNQDYRTEISLWADTVAKRSRNALARGNLANALSRAGELNAAQAQAAAAVQLDPTNAVLRYDLALVLAKLDRNAEAIDAYAEAVRLQPDYADAHNNYAVALARAGRLEDARREFEATLRLRPHDAEAHFNLGALLSELRRGPEASEHFATALRLRPRYADACIAWGTTLAAMGRFDEALERYEEASRMDPASAVARNKAGLVLLATGRVSEAIRAFEEALRIKPGDPQSTSNLALARSRL